MILELHVLQNFVPSNLNRDDTGSPKDCEFGGHRRARISSQCFKRAIRTEFRQMGMIEPYLIAERTKRAAIEIAKRLARPDRSPELALQVAQVALGSVDLKFDDDNQTKYLLFISQAELDGAAQLCEQNWDALAQAAQVAVQSQQSEAKNKKKAPTFIAPAGVKPAMERILDQGRAVDLALFGRMIADLPEKNVEAASQVAHAISTNRVNVEFDFYTAVDDLKPDNTAGAGMLGTIEFNSACFYRYANVDTRQLMANLGNDAALTRKTAEAFLRAAVKAIPTGKQNSMAAHNPPSLVMAVAREGGQWNLANAFVTPVDPRHGDLVQMSVAALDDYWAKLATMYGEDDLRAVSVATTEPERLTHLRNYVAPSLDALIAQSVQAALG